MPKPDDRYSLMIGNLVAEKEGEGTPMFTAEKLMWHGLDYANLVMLEDALFNAPINLGKLAVEGLKQGK